MQINVLQDLAHNEVGDLLARLRHCHGGIPVVR
jgi:hypothetical protein